LLTKLILPQLPGATH